MMMAITAVVLLCSWLLLGAVAGVVVGRVISRADAVECGDVWAAGAERRLSG